MIQRAELQKVSETKGLMIKNCEKDYLLELVMFFLSDRKRVLAFKGGTALYKFHNLNRFSEDLDFDLVGRRKTTDGFTPTILRKFETMGIKGTISETDEHTNETNIRFLIRGPLYDGTKAGMTRLTLNLSKRERPEMTEIGMIVPLYSDIPSFHMSVISPKEIASEKVRCILTREKPRDIYDLWFLTKKKIVADRYQIDRKLSIYRLRYDPDLMTNRIRSMEGMWTRDLKSILIGPLPEFSDVYGELSAAYHLK